MAVMQRNWASLIAQSVKNLPKMQETRIQFLGQEDPLEKEMTTYSSILPWRIPQTEEAGGLQSMGWQESDTTEWLNHEEKKELSCIVCGMVNSYRHLGKQSDNIHYNLKKETKALTQQFHSCESTP